MTDTPLTERGIKQAAALAKRLKSVLDEDEFTLFSSDLLRASQTAEIISKSLNSEVVFLKDLRELNNGVAVGLSNDEARGIMNPLIEPIEDWIPFEGGESWRILYERATKALEQISSVEKRRAVVISHGNTLHCLISTWLGIPLEARITYEQHTCNITWLRVNRLGERTIRKLNECGHLSNIELENIIEYH